MMDQTEIEQSVSATLRRDIAAGRAALEAVGYPNSPLYLSLLKPTEVKVSIFPKPPAGYKPMPEQEIVEHEFDDNYDDEHDEFEEALANCCGNFDNDDGVFRCGAAGSEDCDWECPFARDIGMNAEEIDARDEENEKDN